MIVMEDKNISTESTEFAQLITFGLAFPTPDFLISDMTLVSIRNTIKIPVGLFLYPFWVDQNLYPRSLILSRQYFYFYLLFFYNH